ncbi:prepilin-type N-terminal cleavage/methylation domain-containing protein [Roseateles cavernae]|uniref:prepilin-type N-terminal cleavage/methylation domain-containing protein n=1 Tax=Roseateles cavernae TaxID=3153578 RepID=UPI0032E49418
MAGLNRKRTQRGASLVEAMVAVLLLGVIGLGLVYALSRTLVAHKYHKAQSLAVQGIRAELQSAGLAGGCPASGTATRSSDLQLGATLSISDVQKTCIVTPVTVSIAGSSKSVTLAQVLYELDAETLLGPGTLTLRN